jgi:hypothetical protein
VLLLKYESLEHFEKVHGKAFVFALEQLERILEGNNEGFDQGRF